MTKVVLVEDHALLADVLRLELTNRGFSVEVMVPSGSVESELEQMHDVDLVLMDHDLGAGLPNGCQLAGELSSRGIPVAMLTGVTEAATLGRCLLAGAVGIIHKQDPFDRLIEQIDDALSGRAIGPPPTDRSTMIAAAQAAGQVTNEAEERLAQLSPREQDVLAALVRGRTVAEIAAESFVAISTVRSQVKAIRQKLGVHTQAQAVAAAAAAGWFTTAEH